MARRRTLTHYGAAFVETVRETDQTPGTHGHMKPRGLWYSVDGEWEDWCDRQEMRWCEPPRQRYRVVLGDERILRLSTPAEVREFNEEFGNHRYLDPARPGGIARRMSLGVRWQDVARRWDGIEVEPYLHEIQFDNDVIWYWTWDCASGCVWRPRGIRLRPLRPRRLPSRRGTA